MLKPILLLIPLFVLVAAISGIWSSSPGAHVSPGSTRDLGHRSPLGGPSASAFAARVRALPW